MQIANHEQPISSYERVGGEQGIICLVDVFYQKVLADDDLRDFFSEVPMDRLKRMQKEFFTVALGGPNEYSDINLAQAHQGKGIKTVHFRTFVGKLLSTLAELDLSDEERYQIIADVNTYVGDIVDDMECLTD